jgi:hypothetical protein
VALRQLALIAALAGVAHAQPVDPYSPAAPPPAPAPPPPAPTEPTQALHDANAAATTGDWQRVAMLVDPLLSQQLSPADIAEAHRLKGLVSFFADRKVEAEAHFLAYLKVELDGRLDPALVPPEAVQFFEEVRARHAAELRALRPQRRYFILNFVPVAAQVQNGDRTKAVILGGAFAVLAITNVASYAVLRSWCSSSDQTCDTPTNHVHAAMSLRATNIMSGVGLIATYLYGVYDGVVGYRRRSREQMVAPYATATNTGGVVGVVGSF